MNSFHILYLGLCVVVHLLYVTLDIFEFATCFDLTHVFLSDGSVSLHPGEHLFGILV